MPFTFARWLDPRLQFPAVQHTIMAAMRTVVFVPRDKDASEGDMWYATKDLNLITWRHQARDMVYLRRFDLRADSKNRLGVMWIGAQLNGKDYRITCNLLDEVGRAKLWLNLKAAEVGDGPDLLGADAFAYKARSIRLSTWAGRAPHAAVGSDDDNEAPPASMGGYANTMDFMPSSGELHFNEAVEDEGEDEVYSNG